MYKNLTYFNRFHSIKKYEMKLLESNLFDDVIKTKDIRSEIIYKNAEVLISINKVTVNFLIFDYKQYSMIRKIERLSEMFK